MKNEKNQSAAQSTTVKRTTHNPQPTNQPPPNFKEAPSLMIKGFFMGSADVVPGVSGGTMALILGIYYRLINAIKSFDTYFFKLMFSLKLADAFRHVHLFFLGSIFAGIIAAIVFFTRIIPLPVLIHTHPEPVYGLFFGLIAGSVYLLIKTLPRFGWKEFLFLLGGALFGFWVVNLVPTDTPENPLFLFLTGSIAVTALVLPGISGSFMLLILRKYDYILSNIALLGTDETIDAFLVLVPFGLGMIAGIAAFTRFLSWLLDRFYIGTICILIGFMVGSLYVIWPFQEREYAEFVDTQVVQVTDDLVQSLLAEPEDERLTEYQRIGDIINPGAPVSEQRAELETVKRKLVGSDPFFPDILDPGQDERLFEARSSLYRGFIFIFGGFGLVWILGRLAR
ncbi:MAG: DUF368 domain-containing protein [Balneolales bacterium]